VNADVVVVGGGVIGVCCAYELALAGARVTVLESGEGVGAGCSAGNAGLICPSHSAPLATRAALVKGLRWSLSADGPFALRLRPSLLPWLARFAAACTPARERRGTELLRALSLASLELHERLRDEIGAPTERLGTLNVYETEAGFEHGTREAAEAGLPAQVLAGNEATALEPALAAPVAGAVYYPDELSGDPLAFVRTVAQAAEERGVHIRARTGVRALRARDGRVVVETDGGTLTPETIVLAAGAWMRTLAHGLGLSIPVEGGKGYHVDYTLAESDPRVPIFLQEARVIATPMGGKLRLAGTLELTGLDLSVDERRVAAIERAGHRRVRGLAGRERIEVWRGLRPCPPDGLPLLGRPRAYDNVVLATGHAALGFTLAPVTGLLVAQLVANEPPAHEIAALHPDRFRRAGRRA